MTTEERFVFVPPNGESWQQMEERLFATLQEIAEHAKGTNIVVVTHRGCLRAILPLFANEGREKHAEYSVPTGSITKFTFARNGFDFVGLVPL